MNMRKFLQILVTVGCAIAPTLAVAQGGRGGFGGGGGRQGRGGRTAADTSATGVPRPQLSFTDMVLAKRSEIQLSDSQLVKLNDIRMTATSRRAALTREVDSLKTEMGPMPVDPSVPATDSARKILLSQRRALGSVLGDLHDVDVNARTETLAMLTPLQQKKAELLQEIADTPPNPKAEGGRTGKEGRAAGGRPGGGAGVP